MNPTRAARRLRAAAHGYFWLPCPLCGEYFSGEEWMSPERAGAHFAAVPTEVRPSRRDGVPFVFTSQGICPACTVTGAGCRAYAEYRNYHAGCEAVPPPEPGEPYTMVMFTASAG